MHLIFIIQGDKVNALKEKSGFPKSEIRFSDMLLCCFYVFIPPQTLNTWPVT